MRREVEINIPMFIGIIIIVAISTAILVYIVNLTRDAISAYNERMDEGLKNIEEYFSIQGQSEEKTNEIIDNNIESINTI